METPATDRTRRETVEQLDGLRIGDESDGELVNIYETSEYTLFHAGD
jgi:hypothetical protein